MWEIVESVSFVFVKSPQYHKRLSDKQVQLLEVLFKYRFVSTDLVSSLLGKNRSTVYESFYVLEKQGYIHKFHDKTYRLRGKPAVYCLNTKGVRYLREHASLDQTTLRNFYKNKTAREEHIDYCLNVFNLALAIKRQTNSKFDIFTKYELDRKLAPFASSDLYLQSKQKNGRNYVLDIFPAGTLSWLLRKRIQQYQEYSEED